MPLRRPAVAALALGVTAALVITPVAIAATPISGPATQPRLGTAYASGKLVDLQPVTAEPFDGASATVSMVGLLSSSFTFSVRGINASASGQTFGAHLHSGTCRAGEPATAGPHYNTDLINGSTTPLISTQTEVWLDIKVNSRGQAESSQRVPFVPLAAERAIVIHALPTDANNGTAGARLACLPVRIR